MIDDKSEQRDENLDHSLEQLEPASSSMALTQNVALMTFAAFNPSDFEDDFNPSTGSTSSEHSKNIRNNIPIESDSHNITRKGNYD